MRHRESHSGIPDNFPRDAGAFRIAHALEKAIG
jgi:hypothetical protein